MMRSFIRFRFETRTLTELFMEIVEHRWHDAADVMQRAQRLGIGLASPQQMIVIDLPEAAQSGAGRSVDPHHAVIRLLQQSSVAAGIIVVDKGLVCLIPPDDKERVNKLLRKIAEELGRYFGQEPFVVVSGLCTKLSDYPTAWDRCRRMIRIGRSFGRTGVFASQDFGPLPMLVAAADVEDVRGFVQDSVGAIADHDRQHATPYMETLFSYLREGCRSQACADAMGLHVTTLRYRLARIQELFGVNLDTPERRFAFELAIRLREVIDSRGSPEK